MITDFNWLGALGYILTVLMGALVAYFKHSAAAQERAADVQSWFGGLREDAARFISHAERKFEGTQRGGEKFEWVVDSLYGLLPPTAKMVIDRQTVANIVQKTFDAMADYAAAQLDAWIKKPLPEED